MGEDKLDRRKAEIERRIQQHIDTTGWSVVQSWLTAAEGDNVPYSYTVGLTERDRPELCLVGLDASTSATLLNDLARRTVAGVRLDHGQRIADLVDGFDVVIVEGPATGIIQPTIALDRYGTAAVRLQQCVWPDPLGSFPWDSAYGMRPVVQPIIGRPTA